MNNFDNATNYISASQYWFDSPRNRSERRKPRPRFSLQLRPTLAFFGFCLHINFSSHTLLQVLGTTQRVKSAPLNLAQTWLPCLAAKSDSFIHDLGYANIQDVVQSNNSFHSALMPGRKWDFAVVHPSY